MRLQGMVLGGLALLLSAAVEAAPPAIKPGLWEMKVEKTSGGAQMPSGEQMEKAMKQMQARLAQMPPEQRKMMEAQFGDMSQRFGSNGAMRMCLDKEAIQRSDIPLGDDKGCKTTVKTQTAKRWVAEVSCSQPPTTGQVEALFESDTRYLVKVSGQRQHAGKTMAYAMDMRYHYLGSDCGGIKPVSQMTSGMK